METKSVCVDNVLEKSFPPTRPCTQVKIDKALVSLPE